MLQVTEARERLLSHFKPGVIETVELQAAVGRVLAQNVAADLDSPPFSQSAMDGVAVRFDDCLRETATSPGHRAGVVCLLKWRALSIILPAFTIPDYSDRREYRYETNLPIGCDLFDSDLTGGDCPDPDSWPEF